MSTTAATILIVDDVAANRLVLERMVAARGHTPVSVENGLEALRLMRSRSFDMVLLDIMMPVMSGYTVLSELSADPVLQHVPVVVVSALNDIESVTRCVSLGAVDYLFKPVNRTLLGARIDSCLGRKRLHDREQAAYAAVLAANQAKSEFIAIVSHELKNPLTAILGYADVLQAGVLGPLNDDQARCLGSVSLIADYMGHLLSDLSDLSQIEAGLLRLEYAEVPLATLCETSLRSLERTIGQKNQQLNIVIPATMPSLWADPMRVMQILTNLVSNASKYTPTGGQITVSARQAGEELVEIAVRDTGIGMSEADQHHIFEKFFRSAATAARQERGTGLGLHITRLLVEAQGGTIWFESEPHVGSTFFLTLPAARHPAAAPAPTALSEIAL